MRNIFHNGIPVAPTPLIPIEHDPVAKVLSELLREIVSGARSIHPGSTPRDAYETVETLYSLLQNRNIPQWAAIVHRAIRVVKGDYPANTPTVPDVLKQP